MQITVIKKKLHGFYFCDRTPFDSSIILWTVQLASTNRNPTCVLKLKTGSDSKPPRQKKTKIREDDKKICIVPNFVPLDLWLLDSTPCQLGQGEGLPSSWDWGLHSGFTPRVKPTGSLWAEALAGKKTVAFWFKVCSESVLTTVWSVGRLPGIMSARQLCSSHTVRDKTNRVS